MSDPSEMLVALLRLGERSAEAAFTRLAGGSWSSDSESHRAQLLEVASDERRHDRDLGELIINTQPRMTSAARRFFIGLHYHDRRVHLARIAALDGCVCQIITAVLRSGSPAHVTPPLRRTLAGIRRDEARHVRVARRAAKHFGASAAMLKELDFQVRADFSAVLKPHAGTFESLGVDSASLLRCIDRGPG